MSAVEAADVNRRIVSIIASITRKPLDPDSDVSRASLEEWDSLSHVEILFTVEEAFDVEFDAEAMSEVDSAYAMGAEVLRLQGEAA